MNGADAPVVSVTVVLHNSERELAECVACFRPELDEGFAELIAVDNASPDGSVAVIEREAPNARIVRSPLNRGFAAGVNLAWPHVRGRYWMLLNPDVRLDPCGIRELAAWMDAHAAVGVASADLTDENGGGVNSAGRAVPSPWRSLLETSRLHRLLPRETRGRILRGAYWTGGDQVDAGWVPGTALVARREAVEAAGLLDERFFLYGEDIEWCVRVRQAGWSIGVCSGVRARHHEGSSATRTFGAHGTELRMAEGVVDAVRAVRGERYARAYASAVAMGLRIESVHPRRSKMRRDYVRGAARTWAGLAARRVR